MLKKTKYKYRFDGFPKGQTGIPKITNIKEILAKGRDIKAKQFLNNVSFRQLNDTLALIGHTEWAVEDHLRHEHIPVRFSRYINKVEGIDVYVYIDKVPLIFVKEGD